MTIRDLVRAAERQIILSSASIVEESTSMTFCRVIVTAVRRNFKAQLYEYLTVLKSSFWLFSESKQSLNSGIAQENDTNNLFKWVKNLMSFSEEKDSMEN